MKPPCPGHDDCPRCDVTDPCPCCGIRYVDGEWVPTSSRFFWWSTVDWPWWKPLCLVGWRGGDENCNRTLGMRWGRGAWFVCLNVPLRQEPHADCRMPS